MTEKQPQMYANLPPLIASPPDSHQPRRRRGWMILALVLLAVLVFIVVADIIGPFTGIAGRTMTPRYSAATLQEVVVEDNGSQNKIALVDVEGLITGALIDGYGRNVVALIKQQLKRAAADSAVKAVVLRVNSPGGEVLASDEISRAIADFQAGANKPVVASLGGVAASGGYYVSAPCQWIVAHELTITGSIGVIMHGWNYRGLLEKVGVKPDVYKSGRFKDMLSGAKLPDEVLPEERQIAQSLIDQSFEKFKQTVANGRQQAREMNNGTGRRLANNWAEFADGRILSGRDAYEHGFVDQLGDFSTAVEQAKKLANNIPNANLVRFQQPLDLSALFRLFAQTDAKEVAIRFGVELPKIEAGRLYYLPTMLWHW